MLRAKRYFWFFCIFFAAIILPAYFASDAFQTRNSEVIVKISEKPVRTIQLNDMLGTTTLMHIDTRGDWAKYNMTELLNEMRIGAIRFPGGTLGDNYLWDEHRLQRWEGFPSRSEPGKISDPDWEDYKTLVKVVRAVPSIRTVVLVANFDGAFRTGSDGWLTSADKASAGIDKFADKAKSWAQTLRKELGATYTFIWEIGSETYFGLGTNFSFRIDPAEYAKALKVFYRKIKEGDPQSIVAVAGPFDKNGKGKKQGNPFMYTWQGDRADYAARSWWDVVIGIAGDSFDQATFHNYKSMPLVRDRTAFKLNSASQADTLRNAINFIKSRTSKTVTFSFTEFNGSDKDTAGSNVTGLEHVLDMSEQMGDFFQSGADLLMYWAFRTNDFLHPLVSKKPVDGKLVKHPPFHMMRMWAHYMQPNIYASTSNDDKAIYTFSTANSSQNLYGFFLINRTDSERLVKIYIQQAGKISNAEGETLFDDGKNLSPITRNKLGSAVDNDVVIVPAKVVTIEGDTVAVRLPARSLSAIRLRWIPYSDKNVSVN